jgi:thioredoxin 1|tara:strand:+ start:309 stop:554 length:246 start_codon:yes stop_codon:yes gene_type:complete
MKTAKYFSATWCGPCKVFKPIMKELSDDGYSIEFIDGDESPELANKYNIRSVPTTVIEVDGEEVDRIIGIKSKQEMIEVLY